MYTVQSGDVGNTLRVRVTATNVSGSDSENSEATSTVTQAPPAGPGLDDPRDGGHAAGAARARAGAVQPEPGRDEHELDRLQNNLQIFVRVRKADEPLFAGVSGRRLVQVRIAH